MGFFKDLGKALMTTPDAILGSASLVGDTLRWNASSAPVAGATATFEHGTDQKQVALTRVAAGGLLFGAAGMVVGGMLRKDRTKVYVVITFPDEQQAIIDAPAKDERRAREFAAKVNQAGRRFGGHELEPS